MHAGDPAPLARVAFVLVGTSHPGNVGAAARAMRTMGLIDLRLVAPRFDDVAERPEARAFASGATGVLDGVRRFGTLAEAIGDAALTVAVSAEPREFGPEPAPPEVCAADAMAVLAADPGHRVAFVFGAERTGLSIDEVQACGRLTSIPASPTYSSLNLAQAVQVLAYCVRRAALAAPEGAPAPGARPGPRLADQRAVAGLLEHGERALQTIGFLDPRHPKKLLPRLRRLLLRARLRPEEVDLLRGVLKLMERGGPR
ncbi:MAG: TrmJ/YjtD family RNA methyltransferase [Burkholderiales bacterium]|nr:MAG: TrmJ/YjtD family RNA methyltransferase [Burkholderiales bacterium]